jgi:hypothetical protein
LPPTQPLFVDALREAATLRERDLTLIRMLRCTLLEALVVAATIAAAAVCASADDGAPQVLPPAVDVAALDAVAVTSFAVDAAAGDGAAIAVVRNDAFASRAVLATQSGTVSTSFVGASVEAGEPGDVSSSDASLWWKITASVSGSMIVAARLGSDVEVAIKAYTDAATLPALRALTPVAGCTGSLLPLDASRTGDACSVFAVTAGKTYALQLIRSSYGDPSSLTMMFAVGRTWRTRAKGCRSDGGSDPCRAARSSRRYACVLQSLL